MSLAGSYHGETLGALAVTDVPIFRDAYAPLLTAQATVPCPGRAHRRGGRDRRARSRSARRWRSRLARPHHATTAALIVEPLVQGASGMVMHDPHYLARARELCTRHDVLLIADEIMTGFGRTGTLFAWEQSASRAPDLLCLSKGITGGYLPLSCVLTTDAVYDAFYADDVARGFLHSHSYTGNALACRAALAVLDIFRDDDVIAVNRDKARRWTALAAPLAEHPKVRVSALRDDLGIRGRHAARRFRALVLRRGLARETAAAPDRPHRLLHAALRRHRRRVRAARRAARCEIVEHA